MSLHTNLHNWGMTHTHKHTHTHTHIHRLSGLSSADIVLTYDKDSENVPVKEQFKLRLSGGLWEAEPVGGWQQEADKDTEELWDHQQGSRLDYQPPHRAADGSEDF